GLHQSGFHVAAALEMWPPAAMTYAVNLGRPPERGGVRFHFDTRERFQALSKELAKHLGVKVDEDGHILPEPKSKKLVAPRPTRSSMGMVGSGWLSHYGCTEPNHRGTGNGG